MEQPGGDGSPQLRTVMQLGDESKKLVKDLSDKSRKVTRQGNRFIVPHKFAASDGQPVHPDIFDIVDEKEVLLKKSNLNVKTDISKLNLADLKFLSLWKENKWDETKTAELAGLSPDQAQKTLKKLQYFKTEDARIKALAAEATPERVLAKDMENMETGTLNDSQHKSLDRVAKITGAFKNTADVNVTVNTLVRLELPADEAQKIKDFFDTIATQQPTA